MGYKAHRGPSGALGSLVGYLGGVTQVTSSHSALIQSSLDLRIAVSSDVADGETANWIPNIRTPMFLIRSTATGTFAFWRFPLAIPKDATITNAILSVYQNEIATYVAPGDDRTLAAAQADNQSAPADSTTMSAVSSNLGTSVTWSNAGSFANQAVLPTGDISTVVQQIVNRAGWASGNHILLVATHPGSGSKTHQQRAFDATEAYRPRLQVDFEYTA